MNCIVKFLMFFALLGMALCHPYYSNYYYGGDENRDRVPDALDANRDGKYDGGYYRGYPNYYNYGYHGYRGYPHYGGQYALARGYYGY